MTALFISHSSKDKKWAEQIYKVLTVEGYQSLFLDSHPDDGIHAGADWEQMLYQRLRQSRGMVVLCTANWLASPWCVAEAMMARQQGKPVFMLVSPDVAVDHQIPDFLKKRQYISLADIRRCLPQPGEKDVEQEAHRLLLQGIRKEGLKKHDFSLPERPYPGLDAFQETDAALFFGRDDEIERVIGVLNKRRRNNAEGFIIILGASGCGKSSLVRAGVLPRLMRASGDGGSTGDWVSPPPFMGGKGLDGLAIALALAFKEAGQLRELASVRRRLETAGDLRELAGELLVAGSVQEGSVLLVLDQLEEVFDTADGSDARATLRLLLDASAETGSSIVILATMRSDFLNAFQLFEGAAERYEESPSTPCPDHASAR